MERRNGNLSAVKSSGLQRQILKEFSPTPENDVNIHLLYTEGGETFVSVRSQNLEKLISGGISFRVREKLEELDGIEFKNPGIESKHTPYPIGGGFERIFKINTGLPDIWDSFHDEKAKKLKDARQ